MTRLVQVLEQVYLYFRIILQLEEWSTILGDQHSMSTKVSRGNA